ncbi:MAG: hypothetical protein LBH79_03185 [Nitrososphaerota archaeon]|jgi:regulator of replication initiation timing|nr:hypothetical protein [Nitrososphaerota archaeon]
MSENSQILNEIGLLNVRINDLMNQLNRTVQLLLDENKKLNQENIQLKSSSQMPADPAAPSSSVG